MTEARSSGSLTLLRRICAGIDIRPQIVLRDASRGFNSQDVLGGQWQLSAHPVADSRLRYLAQAGQGFLRTHCSNSVIQRFLWARIQRHRAQV